jgi:drug/metabolite transporter (DMT)-like permease
VNANLLKAYAGLTIVNLLYGINFSVIKVFVPAFVQPFGFIVFRVAIAGSIFWILYLIHYEKIDWKQDGWRMLFCGITGVALNQLLFYKGVSLTTAVNGSIIMTITPILVLIWAAILIRERITLIRVIGILIGLAGALVIISQRGKVTVGNQLGDLLVFINAASFSVYFVLVKPLMHKYKPITVIAWSFAFGFVFVVPVGWADASAFVYTDLPVKFWLSATYAILGSTVIVYLLNVWSLAHVPASVTGSFIYLQPVFATLTAILFFGEIFLLKHLLAMLLVFLGVTLVTTSPVALSRIVRGGRPKSPNG